jgi:tRNA threonylcarbamoyladenosine biosynthesis protein TsaE
MSHVVFTGGGATDLNQAARLLLTSFPGERVFALNGDMGAGKTTFVRAICEELNVIDRVASPTYSLINEYVTSSNEPVYHFDFYRINSPLELEHIGVSEFIDSGSYCFIEWAELAPEFLPPRYVKVSINVKNEDRIIDMKIIS